MPRIRTIKPEFFRHHDLYLAEKKSKLPLRVAFSGLWCCADKEGRFKWKPTELKLDVLPYDELDFNDVLQSLIDNDFIIKYTVNKHDYGFIPKFKEHQRITGTEKQYESKLPEYNGNTKDFQSVSKENDSISKNSQMIDNHMAFQSVSKETTWIEGKEEGEKDNKERREGKDIPENFCLIKIYNRDFKEVDGLFRKLSEKGFLKWKKFIEFIYQNSYEKLFKYSCINPEQFEKLYFPENKWDETIKAILATGVKEEHDLFFRIPQFLKYTEKNGKRIEKAGKSIEFDKA